MKTNKIENINFNKVWKFPKPQRYNSQIDMPICVEEHTQQEFINEYYTSGHKILDRAYFPNLFFKRDLYDENDKFVGTTTEEKERERVTIPLQKEATDIILAHIFGKKIVHKKLSFGKDEENSNKDGLMFFQNIWDYKNMDNIIQEFFERTLICAEAAMYFYIDNGEINVKILSALDGDNLAVQRDMYGNIVEFYRKYTIKNEKEEDNVYIDCVNKDYIVTYTEGGDEVIGSRKANIFNFLPIVYHYRKEGAWWSCVQNNIDSLEKMYSLLAEDNKSKAKGKYFVKAKNPDNVVSNTLAGSDVVITDPEGDFKLIQPVELSTSFKFLVDEIKDAIFQALGIVYPTVKSSGDMPTGSMKMQFFPTERVCKQFINEFSPILDKISKCFQKAIVIEYSNLDIANVNISSKLDLFSPQDDLSTLTATADAYSKGALTARALVLANTKFLDHSDEKDLEKDEEATNTTNTTNTTTSNNIGFKTTTTGDNNNNNNNNNE